MGLRGKFLWVLALCVVAAVGGTTFVQSRLFAKDQLAYVTDFQTTLAVLTEKQIRSRLNWLHTQGEALLARGGIERLAAEIPGCLGGEVRHGTETRSAWALVTSPLGGDAVRWVGRYGDRELVLDLSPSALDGALESSHGASTQVLSAEGTALLKTGTGPNWDRIRSLAEVGGAQTRVLDEATGERSLVTWLKVPAEPAFFVVVATPMVSVERVVGRVYRQSAWLALTFLLMALGVGAWFAANLTSPLLALANRMESVARGDFRSPSGLPTARADEVGGLARAFASMIEELEKLRREVARNERLAAFGKFSAAVAHEIKNPLSSILSNAQVAEREFRGDADPAVLSQALGFVKDETLRANRIVTSLMKFAREVPEAKEDIDLGYRLKQSFAILLPEMEREGVTLEIGEWSEKVRVRASGDPIHEIVANLVANALQAMRNQPAKRIRVDLKVKDKTAIFSLRDSGPGIAREALDHLFEPFFTTKPIGEGTGLGLSVCHGICERYGGTLVATNPSEGGARFEMRLPLSSAELLQAA